MLPDGTLEVKLDIVLLIMFCYVEKHKEFNSADKKYLL